MLPHFRVSTIGIIIVAIVGLGTLIWVPLLEGKKIDDAVIAMASAALGALTGLLKK